MCTLGIFYQKSLAIGNFLCNKLRTFLHGLKVVHTRWLQGDSLGWNFRLKFPAFRIFHSDPRSLQTGVSQLSSGHDWMTYVVKWFSCSGYSISHCQVESGGKDETWHTAGNNITSNLRCLEVWILQISLFLSESFYCIELKRCLEISFSPKLKLLHVAKNPASSFLLLENLIVVQVCPIIYAYAFACFFFYFSCKEITSLCPTYPLLCM